MRLTSVSATDILPVKCFEVTDLADVVVIGGPNGVGKTRLISAILQKFQAPQAAPNLQITVAATSSKERTEWGKPMLDTRIREDANLLRATLTRNKRRTKWTSSVVHFESDRSIQQIKPFAFTWEVPDPWEEQIGWNLTFGGLRARFQDTLHSIFKKVQNQRNRIAKRAEALMRAGEHQMDLDFPDPIAPFREAFAQLLSPKVLLDVDPKSQKLRYQVDGQTFPIDALSSGEREVVNIVFDVILRAPSHTIIVFDEPELHLHPELSFRLLQTLRTIGESNQFVFCTHSPDIISAALDQSVVFVSPPAEDGANQAICVEEGDDTYQALRLLGQSVGVISLAKKVVIIEGTDASLDKKLYGSILRGQFPEFVLVPAGDKSGIAAFSHIAEKVLNRTVWGIDFFMLCDRDAVSAPSDTAALEQSSHGRLRVLPRYHLENYLLDETVLARAFSLIEPGDSWLTSPDAIRDELHRLARSLVSYATSLIVSASVRRGAGNVDLMPKDCHDKNLDWLKQAFAQSTKREADRIEDALRGSEVDALVGATFHRLVQALEGGSDAALHEIPGRPLFQKFAARAKISPARLKTMYLRAAELDDHKPFSEIIELFKHFRALG